jgi:parallel beta-helix repeat protein/VCBS repeat-containing protein
MNYEGIEINSNNNVVQGNYIGTDITGLLARGNRLDDGVEIKAGASGNLIGGTAAGAGNLIAFNALDGVNVVSGSDNTVLGNLIHSNTGLGIDLGTSGVTANDTDDADTGANSLQNYPVITQAEITGTDLTLSGSLDTDGLNTQYRIEFYGNAAGTQDATNGEGRVYLGSITVTTDGSGDAAFTNITLSGVTLVAGDYVTATATRITDPGQVGTDDQLAYGDTSEYAANVVIVEGNNAPVALADSYTAVEGVPYTSQLGVDDLLLNDTDADGDTLTVNTTPVSGPANGSLVLNADGTFTYTPNDNFNGTDSFVYEVSDGNGGSAQATVNVTVQVREIRILLSTQSDVNSSKVPGISNWDAGDVLAIGDPNLTFEPAGSAAT